MSRLVGYTGLEKMKEGEVVKDEDEDEDEDVSLVIISSLPHRGFHGASEILLCFTRFYGSRATQCI